MMKILKIMTALTLAVTTGLNALELPPLFGDGMIIQHGHNVPVWGWASPGEEVSLNFDDDEIIAIASEEDGSWYAEFPPIGPGGSHRLVVQANDEIFVVDNILGGDVWLCSGQSNMEWSVADVNNAEAEMAAATDGLIRHFLVPHTWAGMPSDRLAGGSWKVASPETVGDFTAVGYFFARNLRSEINVPIGLIHASWGGSSISAWLKASALGLETDAMATTEETVAARHRELLENLETKLGGKLPETDRGLIDGEALWADPEMDDSQWLRINAPSGWESQGFYSMDGVAWYRKTITIDAEASLQPARLALGMVDDEDMTWINGVMIGEESRDWKIKRDYSIPKGVLRPGKNVIVVRVKDGFSQGGLIGPEEDFHLLLGTEKLSLVGEWAFQPSAVRIRGDVNMQGIPTILYNKMIHPLQNFPIKGVIWYQGESDANPGTAPLYANRFKKLIESWRHLWAIGDFPFLYVQLANFDPSPDEPEKENYWSVLREAQSRALALPSTAQAITIDIGEANDIHPRNKLDVGRRLALAALAKAYGRDVVYSGPVYDGCEFRDSKAIIRFVKTGSGLAAREGDLAGFELAGSDGVFHPSEAKIDGDQVIVWSPMVEKPKMVRYAWKMNPEKANLINIEGLPASPFRSGS